MTTVIIIRDQHSKYKKELLYPFKRKNDVKEKTEKENQQTKARDYLDNRSHQQ